MFIEKFRLSNISKWLHQRCHVAAISKCNYSQNLETKYTDVQKQKILKIINECDEGLLSQYNLTKGRLKKITKWKNENGPIKSLSDIELIDGFAQTTAIKLFNSVLDEECSVREDNPKSKLKGHILQPNLSEKLRQDCKSVLAVYTTVNSVSWSLIDRDKYQLKSWHYCSTESKDNKKILITDILNTAWEVSRQLPTADLYVMKEEASSLRAAGSDPSNPRVLTVNLQKAQLVAMLLALINDRSHQNSQSAEGDEDSGKLNQKVFFLRSALPFRLFGTLIGNERVSSDQAMESLLPKYRNKSADNSHVHIPEDLISKYMLQKDLEKDMLGRCLFLGLTFMDLCIYNNQVTIHKLTKGRGKE